MSLDARPLGVIEADLRVAIDVRDAQYWRFCRCARAKPPTREACAAVVRLEDELRMARRAAAVEAAS